MPRPWGAGARVWGLEQRPLSSSPEPDVRGAQTAPRASLASPSPALYSCRDLRVSLHLLISFCLLSRLACKLWELWDFALFIAVSQTPKRVPGTQQCSVSAWMAEGKGCAVGTERKAEGGPRFRGHGWEGGCQAFMRGYKASAGAIGRPNAPDRGNHLESKPESLQWKSETLAPLTLRAWILPPSLPFIFLSMFFEHLLGSKPCWRQRYKGEINIV